MVSVRVFVFNDKSTRAPEDTPEGGFVMQITWKSHGDLPGMANTQWVVSAEGGGENSPRKQDSLWQRGVISLALTICASTRYLDNEGFEKHQ